MTVQTTTNKATYTGNGVTTIFPFTFATLPSGDLVVTLIDPQGTEFVQTETTDYTVTGKGNENGGSVNFIDAPTSGWMVLIQRILPLTQPTDFKNQGAFFPRTHERAFDRTEMQIQQINEKLERSIEFPPYVPPENTAFPVPGAGELIGWNEAGDALRTYSLQEIATVVAFSDKLWQKYIGDGVTTSYALSYDPGSIGNLEITIDGVMQVPEDDFTYMGTTLTFGTAPPNAGVILIRYDVALPTGYLPDLAQTVSETFTKNIGDTSVTTLQTFKAEDFIALYINGIREFNFSRTVPNTITFDALEQTSLIGVEIGGSTITDGDVTQLRADLIGVVAGKGADMVGLPDFGGYYSSVTVEGGMQEIGASFTATNLAVSLRVTGVAGSVDGELMLYSGITGYESKRATGTGFARLANGVLSTVDGADDDIAQRKSGAWTNRTLAQVSADLQSLIQAYGPRVQTVTSASTVTPTFTNDQVNITAQAAGLTLANPSGTPVPAHGIVIRIKDNGTARTIAYGAQYRAVGVTLPTATVANKTVYLGCVWNNDDTKLDVVAVAQEA